MFWNDRKVVNLGSVDIGGANATTAYEFGERAHVKRFIWVCTTAHTTPGSIITVTRVNADGTGSAAIGSFTVPAVVAANGVVYVDVGIPAGTSTTLVDGSVGHTALPDMPVFDVGEEIVLTSDGGGAGVGTFFMEFQSVHSQPLPEAWTRVAYTPA